MLTVEIKSTTMALLKSNDPKRNAPKSVNIKAVNIERVRSSQIDLYFLSHSSSIFSKKKNLCANIIVVAEYL